MKPQELEHDLRHFLFASTVTCTTIVAFVSNDVRTAIVVGAMWYVAFRASLRFFARRRARQGDTGSVLETRIFTFANSANYLLLGSVIILLAEFGFKNTVKLMLKKYPYPEADGIISSIIRFLVVGPSSEWWFIVIILIITTAFYLANVAIRKPKKGAA
jgi:hypothetical protein